MPALYALCAMLFAAIFIVGVLVLGGDKAQFWALFAALLGCAGQFVAQGRYRFSAAAADILAFMAFAAAFVALILFGNGL